MIGYGTDTYCTDRLCTGRLVSGVLLVKQALLRRFSTPRGVLLDDPTYGLDLANFVGASADASLLASLPGMISAEASKEDRITGISTSVQSTRDAAGLVTLTVTIRAELVDSGEDFAATLSVDSLTGVQLL